jgi:mannonate dehydratase
MIQYFGAQKKIFKIHFRNVSAPLPHFIETFMDDGYYDMYKIMKALREVNFDGIVIPDHIPGMTGPATSSGPGSGSATTSAPRPSGNLNQMGIAYSIAYMRALRDRANREVQS